MEEAQGYSLSTARERFQIRVEFTEPVPIYDVGDCSSVPFSNKDFFLR